MKFGFAEPTTPTAGAAVVLAVQERCLGPAAAALDQAAGGALTRAMEASRFTGKREETLTVMAPQGVSVGRILLVGLGKAEKIDALALQAAGGAAVAALVKAGPTEATILVDTPPGTALTPSLVAAELALGARLRSYRFDKYRTTEKEDRKPSLIAVQLCCADPDAARHHFAAGDRIADGVFLTRDLVSEPANLLYPAVLAERCLPLAEHGVEVDILDRERLTRLGMGALLGVAQGSIREPRLVVLKYSGAPDATDQRPLAFVGKGVTFDTGGISIKPAAGMEDMKWDMGGAGVVIGLIKALAGRKAKVNVVGVVGLVENMPGGNAQRPGDIVTSLSGQTIEVLNTDAEGRLVLADCLWYTQDTLKPRLMVDLATLTGAVIVALGHRHAGLFANDDELARQLTEAGTKVGETLWRLPLDDAYDKDIESEVADMKNIGSGRDAGSSIGAQFLQRFVNKVPWAHLDIAGVTWSKKEAATVPKGGTGFGVRLLDRFVADYFEA
ncbi:MAG: leucyl aminopeptidase [Azospirillum sp.]|nr:leucyl aminopeptidase [Azospirillum sp.]